MSTVALLLYDRFVLIALDAMPGVMSPIEEVTIPYDTECDVFLA
jgi:hypothetical protein